MTDDHNDNDENKNNNKLKGKLFNLDDWDDAFKKLGQKSYKEIWDKPKK